MIMAADYVSKITGFIDRNMDDILVTGTGTALTLGGVFTAAKVEEALLAGVDIYEPSVGSMIAAASIMIPAGVYLFDKGYGNLSKKYGNPAKYAINGVKAGFDRFEKFTRDIDWPF